MVDKVLNGHLPTAQDLAQATEPMSREGAKPQAPGTTPVNNIPSGVVPPREVIVQLPAQTLPPVLPGNAETRARKERIVAMLEKLGQPGQEKEVIKNKSLTVIPGDEDRPEVTVCKAILAKAAPTVTGVQPTISAINHYQRQASPEQLLALENAMNEVLK